MTWESCLFNAEEEAEFLANYLYPTFQKNEIDTKIIIYDHNKEKLYTRALAEFSNPAALKAASGITEDLNAGVNGYMDWNILLDSNGGPNHKKNYCNSPVMLNSENTDYIKSLAFYYIGHYSKFIVPGSHRIAYSKYMADITMTSFKNPDNSIVVVMANRENYNIDFCLCMNDIMFKDCLEAQSIVTYVLK